MIQNLWNVLLDEKPQFNHTVDKDTAYKLKDKLIKEGNREVKVVRYERVIYVYTYKNIEFYKNMRTNED